MPLVIKKPANGEILFKAVKSGMVLYVVSDAVSRASFIISLNLRELPVVEQVEMILV